MKKLVTERLILRQFKISDLDDFYEYAKNPKIGPMAGWKQHENIDESKQILNNFIISDEIWAISLKMGGKVIGSIGLHKNDKRRPDVEGVCTLGYVLSEDYWGNGYMHEACEEVISYAFEELKINLLAVYHFTSNDRSKRVIEKCGFTYEGIMRRACKRVYDNIVFDQACYSMTPKEYASKKKINNLEMEENFGVVNMSVENARKFISWKYEGDMSIYNCPPHLYENTVNEVMNPKETDSFFAVYDSLGQFFGVYRYEFNGTDLGIEFRIHPERMGKGYTKSFINEAIRFARQKYHFSNEIVLKIPIAYSRAKNIIDDRGAVKLKLISEVLYETVVEFIYYNVK